MEKLKASPLGDTDPDHLRTELEQMAVGLASPSTSRMAWRFYAALFLFQDLTPLSARELCELISASSTSASVSLRELEQAGLISRTRLPGTRSDVYDLVDEKQYAENYARSLRRPHSSLRSALEVLPEESRAAKRIRSMIDLGDYLADRMPDLLQQWTDERAHLFGR
jgi:Predicted transcriptional regulators